MKFNAPPALGWQALKYAARRLPDADCEAFEEQLGTDQTAREAVAQAVELSHTVAVLHGAGGGLEVVSPAPSEQSAVPAYTQPVARRATPAWRSAAGWMSIGVAASLAFVLTVPQWFSHGSNSDSNASNDQVTTNWASLQNTTDINVFPVVNELALEDALKNDSAANDADNSQLVPEWLMLGVEKDAPANDPN